MSQVHGKQIKDTSVLLSKINPATGQTLTLVGTSKIQQPQSPLVGDDLANKAYVDSVAAGLDPKESVNLATTGNISGTYNNGTAGVGATLSGTSVLSVDGVTITAGDRILVKNQTNTFENGIYDVTTDGTNWVLTRANDFDGDPGNEVNGGEFTFIMSGNTQADTGWVVSSPSGVNATIGTTPIIWVQFSSAGVVNAGLGLYQDGTTFNMGAADDSLTIGATQTSVNTDGSTIQTGVSGIEVINGGITETQINQSVAGAGLTGGGGSALAVNVSNGLSIVTDNVELGGVLTKNTTVNGGLKTLQLGSSGDKLQNLNIYSDGNSLIDSALNVVVNGRQGIQLTATGSGGFDVEFNSDNGDSIITDNGVTAKGLQYAADYSATFVNRSLVDKQYVDNAISTLPTGDVTGVTAGAGLVGGGNTGFLQMDIELTNNGGLTFSTSGDAGTLEADYNSLSSTLAGSGLVQNGTTLDVQVGDGLVILSDTVEASLVVNSGLTFSGGAFDVSLGTGLSISGGDIITDASLSLLTGNLSNTSVATGSSIQTALEALDTQVGNVEISENISVDLSPAPAANFTSGINAVSATTLASDSDGEAWVYVNGVQQVVGTATSSAWYWSADGGTTARANKIPLTGDQLIVNIDTLGYSISGSNNDDDIIEIKYDALS